MKFFEYKNYHFWSDGLKVGGAVLVLGGSIVLIAPFLFPVEQSVKSIALGAGAISIGVILLGSYSGILFDFSNKRWKHYQRWAGISFGDWEPIPEVKKLDMIHHEVERSNIPNGIHPTITSRYKSYKCVIFMEGQQPLVLDFRNEKKAIKAMELFSDELM
ncbi:hypothetical protein [Algoriphagus sediminis]|uniref:Uncharacterized protein n=1 Tax=Algoriphagus sediminis TaxID=3057113 RepID=A0ABT7YBN1_9BACT|nr:hypothetical protein [Algoriphagus sediminis]MDN3203926.1 hypothetical protein [Algoriphagus sediminis]